MTALRAHPFPKLAMITTLCQRLSMRPPPRFATSSSYVGQGELLLLRLRRLSRLTPFLVALMLCAGLALTPAQVEAAYTAVEVAILPEGSSRLVRAINDAGEIVGGGRRGGRHRGLLLRGGGRQDIDGLPGSDYTVALGINRTGQIVGTANTRTGMQGFRSQRTTGIVALPPLTGDSSSMAFAINDSGQAVGFSSGPTGIRAVVWTLDRDIQALPALSGSKSSRGFAINDQGDAVGVADTPSGPRAVFWGGGAVQNLGTLSGHGASEALSINNNGDIVGSSGDLAERRAVLWALGADIKALGVLPGGTSSRALGVNDRREVVGNSRTSAGVHAFRWTDRDGMQDLNDLLTSRVGFVLTDAVAISPLGLILAIGVDAARTPDQPHDHDDHELPTRIFRLVPVPAP